MPRNGSGQYSLPAGYQAVDGQDALASQHNEPLEDIRDDLNNARPITAGGTGATDAPTALSNLGALALVGGTMTGPFKTLEVQETVVALTGTTPTIDLEAGTVFTLTTSGNITFTFSNPAATGTASAFVLQISAGGTHTLTWPAGVRWAGGGVPDAPADGETDMFLFSTLDGGISWNGFQVGDALA